MPTNARKRHRIGTGGPWGTGLLLLGVAAVAQGLGYMTGDPNRFPTALQALGGDVVPIQSWAMLWVVAGCYAVYKALRPPQRHIDVWPLVAIISLWSAAHFIQFCILLAAGVVTRDWSSALGWGSLATYIICMGRCVNPPVRPR